MKTTIKDGAIDAFKFDDRPWRLNHIGTVRRNPNVPSEQVVSVSLSPMRANAKDALSTDSVDLQASQIVNIGTGMLPFLAMGTIWLDGRPAIGRWSRPKGKVTLHTRSCQVVRFGEHIPSPLPGSGRNIRYDCISTGARKIFGLKSHRTILWRSPRLALQTITSTSSHFLRSSGSIFA